MTVFFKVHDPFLISGSELLNLAELSYSSMFFWGQTGNHLHFCNSWWLEVVPDYSRLLLPWEAGNGVVGVCVWDCQGSALGIPRLFQLVLVSSLSCLDVDSDSAPTSIMPKYSSFLCFFISFFLLQHGDYFSRSGGQGEASHICWLLSTVSFVFCALL